MVWPDRIDSLDDVPMSFQDRELAGFLKPEIHRAVIQYLDTHYEAIVELTNGNEEKERLLGGLLVNTATMASNVGMRALEGIPIP